MFIYSSMNYCNSMLYKGITDNLQFNVSIQNAAARLITQTGRREHITPVLRKLHRLPVRRRTELKLHVQDISQHCTAVSIG